MRRPSILALAALALALATATAGRADDAPPPLLMGDAAWARLLGNTATGTTSDGPFSEFFAADGTLTIVDNDGKAGGHWALRDGKLCTQVEDEDEECRALEVTGAAGAFIDDAGSRYPFSILPGNPKAL